MELSCGGHITHGDPQHISSRLYNFVRYGVDRKTERIDFAEVRSVAKEHRPKLVIAGASFYPRIIDFAAFREIAEEVDAYFLADMAHLVGLVAGGVHPNPVPFADVVTCSTHKTLRAPRGGGLILCKKEYADKIDQGVHPGLQDAPLLSFMAARAVVFKEAMSPKFREYAKQVVANAKAMAEGLMEKGFRLVTNGTDNHLMIIDLRNKNTNGPEAERALESVRVNASRIPVPFDPLPLWISGSGLRVGTPAITTRGMKEPEMRKIVSMLSAVLNAPKDNSVIGRVKGEVEELVRKFPLFGEEIKIRAYRQA
jgi:glycine hydroxymethyltransferase